MSKLSLEELQRIIAKLLDAQSKAKIACEAYRDAVLQLPEPHRITAIEELQADIPYWVSMALNVDLPLQATTQESEHVSDATQTEKSTIRTKITQLLQKTPEGMTTKEIRAALCPPAIQNSVNCVLLNMRRTGWLVEQPNKTLTYTSTPIPPANVQVPPSCKALVAAFFANNAGWYTTTEVAEALDLTVDSVWNVLRRSDRYSYEPGKNSHGKLQWRKRPVTSPINDDPEIDLHEEVT